MGVQCAGEGLIWGVLAMPLEDPEALPSPTLPSWSNSGGLPFVLPTKSGREWRDGQEGRRKGQFPPCIYV